MSKVKIVVGMDCDGHFNAALRNNRDDVVKVLKCVDDGQYYLDIVADYELDMKNPWNYTLEEWNNLLYNFTQRGTIDIVNV